MAEKSVISADDMETMQAANRLGMFPIRLEVVSAGRSTEFDGLHYLHSMPRADDLFSVGDMILRVKHAVWHGIHAKIQPDVWPLVFIATVTVEILGKKVDSKST